MSTVTPHTYGKLSATLREATGHLRETTTVVTPTTTRREVVYSLVGHAAQSVTVLDPDHPQDEAEFKVKGTPIYMGMATNSAVLAAKQAIIDAAEAAKKEQAAPVRRRGRKAA